MDNNFGTGKVRTFGLTENLHSTDDPDGLRLPLPDWTIQISASELMERKEEE